MNDFPYEGEALHDEERDDVSEMPVAYRVAALEERVAALEAAGDTGQDTANAGGDAGESTGGEA